MAWRKPAYPLASALIQDFRQNIHTPGSTHLIVRNSHQFQLLTLGSTYVRRTTSTSTSVCPIHPSKPSILSCLPLITYLEHPQHSLCPLITSSYPTPLLPTLHSPVYSIPHPLLPIALTPLYSTHSGQHLRYYAGLRHATFRIPPTLLLRKPPVVHNTLPNPRLLPLYSSLRHQVYYMWSLRSHVTPTIQHTSLPPHNTRHFPPPSAFLSLIKTSPLLLNYHLYDRPTSHHPTSQAQSPSPPPQQSPHTPR